ncbi:hypothetical protein AMAG_10232 [Allomyces macrogynus ATCC 38327]|uniref:Class E vacuolar protein-sorting machinery protein HSE1 n=1 Tax=Allomyces macrogynus (strain ATCC 38327) TaxID=578462 RepID=A0A0L0SU62_ALLM3|nr:hypothetical protein AMAG_10232 [Allomyces macrogynus ATCC 38327]|eukprot:KNE65945.1 hypothetical protein AMAG_10232 [Allomyces macrogynus ATCC 38327]
MNLPLSLDLIRPPYPRTQSTSMSNVNEIRDMVDAATSENLVSDDWAMIMDICDRIEQVDNGPRTCVLAIAKRIPHKNQNVVLHALTLTEALVKNCGVAVQHEISSRPFTEVLVKKLTASAQFHVRALYDFAGAERGELPFKAGDVLAVVDADYDDWWTASFRGKSGLIPANYVERLGGSSAPTTAPPRATAIASPAPAVATTTSAAASTTGLDRAAVDALLRDASAVDDLLSALAALDPRTPPSSSPGVQAAYSRVVAMRPGLINQLKHATDLKDRLATLHEQLTRARATYDRLMDQVLRMPKGPYGAPAAFAAPPGYPGPGMYGLPPMGITTGLDRAAVDALLRDASAVDDLLSALAALDPRTPPSSSPGVQAAYSRVVAMRPGLINQLKHATDLKDRLATLHEQLTRARATYDRLMDQVLRMPKGPYGAPAAFAAPPGYPGPGMYGPPPMGMYAPPGMPGAPQPFPPGAAPGGFAPGPVPENATSAYMPPPPQGPPQDQPPHHHSPPAPTLFSAANFHQGPPPPMQHPQPTGAYAPGPTLPPGAPAPHYAPGPTPPPGAGGAPHYVYGPPGVPVQPTGTPGYAPPPPEGYAPAPGWHPQQPPYGGYAGVVPPHATGSPQPSGGFAGAPPVGMALPPGQQPPPPQAYYQPS